MTKQSKQDAAIKELLERGYTNEKKEDRHGETKSGWFCDDVFLGRNPVEALRNANGS